MNFEEILNDIKETNYERNNNIKIVKKRILYDWGDLKIIAVDKSTGEVGLVIIFKASKIKEVWFSWYPSENQLNHFPEIKKIYDEINNNNSTKWKK